MNLKKNLLDLKKSGITKIKNVYSRKFCEIYKKKSEILFDQLVKRKKINTFSSFTQVINSPFQYDSFFFQQIYFKELDKLLIELLDENYVLINSNLINHKIVKNTLFSKFSNDRSKPSPVYNSQWHTDARYIRGRKIGIGLSYIVTIPLDDFTKKNGTRYIPNTHLSKKIPNRNGNYDFKVLEANKGDMIIFDSGLWHKAGDTTEKGRWSIFNYYGPWWMKPYFLFDQMLGKKKLKSLNKNLKRMLHFYSTPPINDHKRTHTVIKY